jgi:hypothetical protein
MTLYGGFCFSAEWSRFSIPNDANVMEGRICVDLAGLEARAAA